MVITLELLTPQTALAFKDVRLRALLDSPSAFSSTYAAESQLTDADWKHGQTDSEIFTVIRDGAKQTGMRAYGSRIPTNDIWNLVNYVRTLGPKTTKSH